MRIERGGGRMCVAMSVTMAYGMEAVRPHCRSYLGGQGHTRRFWRDEEKRQKWVHSRRRINREREDQDTGASTNVRVGDTRCDMVLHE